MTIGSVLAAAAVSVLLHCLFLFVSPRRRFSSSHRRTSLVLVSWSSWRRVWRWTGSRGRRSSARAITSSSSYSSSQSSPSSPSASSSPSSTSSIPCRCPPPTWPREKRRRNPWWPMSSALETIMEVRNLFFPNHLPKICFCRGLVPANGQCQWTDQIIEANDSLLSICSSYFLIKVNETISVVSGTLNWNWHLSVKIHSFKTEKPYLFLLFLPQLLPNLFSSLWIICVGFRFWEICYLKTWFW